MNFLKSQSPRERGLIYGAMALLLLLGIWQFAIKPVLKSGDVAERAQSHALRDFAIVRDGAGALGANSAQTGARKPFDRKAIIDIARSASLPISRVQPQSDTVIKVWFDDAPSRSV
ncbi:MAG: type II secretion system protein GspM, partial [Robiginitomaculum sp.]